MNVQSKFDFLFCELLPRTNFGQITLVDDKIETHLLNRSIILLFFPAKANVTNWGE